ncbi:hypothetical protein ILYODFUR_030118 [Ilyodon furcidens]|uniref:Uncharacterized protein n=1 Tax=Ilyodon furcidens TaxID=33524 RepID=A0ABV0UDT4_9TELE
MFYVSTKTNLLDPSRSRRYAVTVNMDKFELNPEVHTKLLFQLFTSQQPLLLASFPQNMCCVTPTWSPHLASSAGRTAGLLDDCWCCSEPRRHLQCRTVHKDSQAQEPGPCSLLATPEAQPLYLLAQIQDGTA